MTIDSFKGDYAYLSNFFPRPFTVHLMVLPTLEVNFYAASVEHAFQAAKTLNLGEMREVLRTASPGDAKRMGRAVTLREDWEKVKDIFMKVLVTEKFRQNPDLMLKLVETGSETLIEGNNWGDTYWGEVNGKGLNTLGRILMEVREEWVNNGEKEEVE